MLLSVAPNAKMSTKKYHTIHKKNMFLKFQFSFVMYNHFQVRWLICDILCCQARFLKILFIELLFASEERFSHLKLFLQILTKIFKWKDIIKYLVIKKSNRA